MLKYALKAHASNVVKLVWLEDVSILISGGLDGVVKFWSVPAAVMQTAAFRMGQ